MNNDTREDRVYLGKGIQRQFLSDAVRESNTNDLMFSEFLRVPISRLRNWKYGINLIPVNIFNQIKEIAPKTHEDYSKKIKDIRPPTWGSIKGGKKTIKMILSKYGQRELNRRRLNGGLSLKAKIRAKQEREIEEFIPGGPDFFELYGILIGDGCLYYYKYKKKVIKRIRIDGSLNEIDYYQKRIVPLFSKVFGKKIRIKRRNDCNGIFIQFNSNHIFETFKRKMSFPVGLKGNVRMNKRALLASKQEKTSLLRGLIDTDGGVFFVNRKYPYISFVNKSGPLIRQASSELKRRGFRFYINKNRKTGVYYLVLSGKDNMENWIKKIGFSNPVHHSKFLYWKKFGECPPDKELPMVDRLKRLNLD